MIETNGDFAESAGHIPSLAETIQQIALIISSCDDFYDTWHPFTYFFAKFWPDCPVPSYLIVNELPVIADLFQPIRVGPDRGWASNFRRVLEQISQPYILYLQDDYFLEAPVLTSQILEDCAWCIAHGVDSLCFSAYPTPQSGFTSMTERFGLAPVNSDGRTRCQFSLWKKSALLQVLREGESAWEMESRGSPRTRNMKIMVYEREDATPIHYLSSAILRGLWTKEALDMCRRERIQMVPRMRGRHRAGQQFRKLRRAFGHIARRLWLRMRGNQSFDLRRAELRSR